MEKSKLATILLFAVTIFWGMTFVFVKEGISKIDVYSFISYRFLIAGMILLLIFFKRFRRLDKKTIRGGLILSFFLGAGYVTQTIGLLYTTPSKSAFITGLYVIFVPIFLVLISKKLLKSNHIISVILAAVGLGLLTLNSSLTFNQGDFWSFVCAIFFAFYIIYVPVYTKDADSVVITAVQLLAIGIATGIVSLLTKGIVVPTGPVVWKAILFTSIFATALVYVIENEYQKYVSEIKTAIIFAFEPIFAAVTSFFYLHEIFTLQMIIGGALIFAGMLISEAKTSKKIDH